MGSEPGVGWGFISALARHHDLWVIVEEEKFRADIERYLTDNSDVQRTVHFFFFTQKAQPAATPDLATLVLLVLPALAPRGLRIGKAAPS